MERTFVILKPCTIQRGLIGETVSRFEKKGLTLVGMKMVWLTDEILSKHYARLRFFLSNEIFDYEPSLISNLYTSDEI